MINLEDLKQNILSWVKENLGTNFKFRKYQLEIIQYIIKSIFNDNRETTIIEAPTGSGKSLISIIAAGVLSKYYNKSSYILCSDLYLWQQYTNFIQLKQLQDFGYLKGSRGNYTCHVSKCDFSIGRCRLSKVSFRTLKDYKWRRLNHYECYETCTYMRHREKAQKSSVTLLTYQLWLHHMNLVNEKNDLIEKPFPKRDVIFCDECHNIPDLVQQFCAPTIKDKDLHKILDILDYATTQNPEIKSSLFYYNIDHTLFNHNVIKNEESKIFTFNDVFNVDNIAEKLHIIFDGFKRYTDDVNQVKDLLNFYEDILYICDITRSALEPSVHAACMMHEGNGINKVLSTISARLSWLETYYRELMTFMEAIENAGIEYLLLEINQNYETKENTYVLSCAKEDYLCNEYLLRHANNKVLLSATVGSKQSFDENIGIKYTKSGESILSRIPSTFSFKKSPIYISNVYKLSYSNKSFVFPQISNFANKIIYAHSDVRGIIHSGSYENARTFYFNAPADIKKRLFLYGSAKEKEELIDKFKNSKNGILLGPTLVEGIDLPNDYCRFIIIMKVPYPNMGSKLVKTKKELFPLWYSSAASNLVIQGIGRGVRNENDYCSTYILDGNFSNLYYKTLDQYPKHLQERMIMLNR